MQSKKILSRVKSSSSGLIKSLKNRVTRVQKKNSYIEAKPVRSGQFTEVAKDKLSVSFKHFKKWLNNLRKYNTQKTARYVLAVLLLVYLVGGVIVVSFAYSTKETKDKKTGLNITQRDKYVKRYTAIYPFPAARVNGEFISLREFYRQVSYLKTFNSQVPDSLSKAISDEPSLRKQVLDNIIETKIVTQEAQNNKIEVTKTDIEEAFKTAADANGGKAEIEKVLKNLYGMNSNDFKLLIKDQLYREKIREKLLVQVQLKHILVTDQAKADAALARLQKGEVFEEVVKTASEDSTSKDKGGDIGWLGRDDLKDKIDPEFEKAAMVLQKGQTSGIIKTKYGYHIIKLEDKKGKIDKSFSQWLSEIKKKAEVSKYIKS